MDEALHHLFPMKDNFGVTESYIGVPHNMKSATIYYVLIVNAV